MILNIKFYLPRIDKILLGDDGIFKYVKGTSAFQPKAPEDVANSMTLYAISCNPYVFNVKDVNKVKETQGDLLNVFNKYVGDNKMLQDAGGYHKALFAASNPDKIANHFYEQGKADAIKQLNADSKNINMDPRKAGTVETEGVKIRAISGDDSSKLKIKLRK